MYQYHQRGFTALRETSSSSPAASPKQKEVCAVQQTAWRRKCSGQLFTQSDLLPDDKYSLPLALIKNMENRMCQHKKWLNWLPSQQLWLPESTWSLRQMVVTWPDSAQQIFPFSSYYHPSFTTLSFKAVKTWVKSSSRMHFIKQLNTLLQAKQMCVYWTKIVRLQAGLPLGCETSLPIEHTNTTSNFQ